MFFRNWLEPPVCGHRSPTDRRLVTRFPGPGFTLALPAFRGRSFSSDIIEAARSAFPCAASPAEGLAALWWAACSLALRPFSLVVPTSALPNPNPRSPIPHPQNPPV